MRPSFIHFCGWLIIAAACAPVRAQVETLHAFPAPPPEPAYPNSELIVGSDGALYGSCKHGGPLYRVSASGEITAVRSSRPRVPPVIPQFFNYVLRERSALQPRVAEGPPGQFIKFFDYAGDTYKASGPLDGRLYVVNTTEMPDGWPTYFYEPMVAVVDVARLPLGGIVDEGNGSFLASAMGGYAPGLTQGTNILIAGRIFRFTSGGSTTVASFSTGTDAVNGMPITADHPRGALAKGPDGSIWGTATTISHGKGAVFKVHENGLHIVHSFFGGDDGGKPLSGLVRGTDGNFYGTTALGGAFDGGTVFKVTPTSDSGVVTTLASFDAVSGASPGGSLAIAENTIYGVTGIRSLGENEVALAPGKIFKLDAHGNITALTGSNARMAGGLTSVGSGSFVGATHDGGDEGGGSIYRIDPQGVVATVANFRNPYAPKVGGLARAPNGTIFGTATVGGAEGKGFLFQIDSDGTFKQLESFGNAVGYRPRGICIDAAGVVRGVTLEGGVNGDGTIFKFVPGGTLGAVVSFSAIHGTRPNDDLLCASDGNFYGTTRSGGRNGAGTVFRLSADDQFSTVHHFGATATDVRTPLNGLVETAAGQMFGILASGLAGAEQNVFRVDGSGNLAILGQVPQSAAATYSAYSPLIAGPDGSLYGVASNDVVGDLIRVSAEGVVTKLAEVATEALMLASDGNFYGLNRSGNIVRITPAGAQSIIHAVRYDPMASPDVAGLVEDRGSLYGVSNGGLVASSQVFRFPLGFNLLNDPPVMTNTTAAISAQVENFQSVESVTVHLEYGTTMAYGNRTAAEVIPPGTSRAIAHRVSDLIPDTTYFFRVVAVCADTTATAVFEAATRKHPPAMVVTGTAQPQPYHAGLHGTVDSPNGPVTVWFEIGEKPDLLQRHPSSQTLPAGMSQPFQGSSYWPDQFSKHPLLANSVYYFRAAAEFDGMISYGAVEQFITADDGVAVTGLATEITATGVSLNGTTPTPWEVNFQYGTTRNYGSFATGQLVTTAPDGRRSLQARIAGLTPGTTYHYRIIAATRMPSPFQPGAYTGKDMTFTTADVGVTTLPADQVTRERATLHASVDMVATGQLSFEFGPTTEYGSNTVPQPFTGSWSPQLSAVPVAGLSHGTTYHFRAVAMAGGLTRYGADMTFTTLDNPVVAVLKIVTGQASNVTLGGAVLGATVEAPKSGYLFFQFGSTTQYGNVTGPQLFAAASTPQLFDIPIDALIPGNTYHFRAVAVVEGTPEYGADVTFTTGESPTIVTLAATDVSATSARLAGLATAFSAPAMVYFEYGNSTSLGNQTTVQLLSASGTEQSFAVPLGDLAASSRTYYRAVLAIGGDVYRGETMEFVTALGNSAPAARADYAAIRAGESVVIDVLANDSDADGDQLSIESFTQDGSGVISLEAEKLRYTASASGSAGMRTGFSYTIRDPHGATSTAMVELVDNLPALTGVYRSRFVNQEGAPAGQLQLRLMDDGAFSGTMKVGGTRRVLRGQGPLDGRLVTDMSAGEDGLMLALALETAGPGQQPGRLSGEVSRNGETFTLLATSKLVSRALAGSQGRYTLVLKPSISGSGPPGAGWGMLRVNNSGAVRVKGMLGDGAHFSASDQQRVGGETVLCSRLYGGSGWLMGMLNFRNGVDADVSGSVSWHKSAQINGRSYPNGFDLQLEGRGSIYTVPGTRHQMLSYSNPVAAEAMLLFSGQPAELPWSVMVRIAPNDVASIAENPHGVELKLNRATGKFSGSFSDAAGRRTPFHGVVVQRMNEGAGHFGSPGEHGAVQFIPQ